MLPVERVEGIFPAGEFNRQPLPDLLVPRESASLLELALWREEPLQVCQALQLEQWGREVWLPPSVQGRSRVPGAAAGGRVVNPVGAAFPLVLIRPGFRGGVLYRSAVVPLLDLPLLLGVDAGQDCSYPLLYGTELGPVGLPVAQVLQIVERRLGTVATNEPVSPARLPAEMNFVYNGKAYPLLDFEALLDTLPG